MSPAPDDRGRDLPRDLRALRLGDTAVAAVRSALVENDVAPPEGLWVTVHDDRSRALDHFRRSLCSGAAAAAQELLKAADELMRMSGNGRHNSINGFDRVAEEVLTETMVRLVEAQKRTLRMWAELTEMVDRGGWREQVVLDRARREGRS